MPNSDAPPAKAHRGLLALVIILGVLILLGVGALIATAALRGARPASTNEPYRASVTAPGQRILSSQLDGNRILLHLSGPDGDEFVVMDAGSGRVIGRIAAASP